MSPQRDIVQGTLDMMILKSLSLEPMHGWGVTNRIQQITTGALRVNPGSLYPAFERLQHKRWISADWAITENGRRAKYYKLTQAGRKQLGEETREWRRLVAAVDAVLGAT